MTLETPELTNATSADARLRGLGVDLETLLAPLAEGDGAGVSLRYEPVYQQIRAARHEDDPTVPMGEWERPLEKADWKMVASLCTDALRTRSKDFQLAAWLCEAWTHLRGIEGFTAGVALLSALMDRYWDTAWPRIEDGDSDARCAPFTWINDALALVLMLNVPLLRIDTQDIGEIGLYDWQCACAVVEQEKDGPLSSEALAAHVHGANLERLVSMRQQLASALDAVTALDRRLDARLAHQAPSVGQVADMLQRLVRAVASLLGDRAPAGDDIDGVDEIGLGPYQGNEDAMPLPSISLDAGACAARELIATIAVPADGAGIVDRAHAYRLLRLVADYLMQKEPHSPTPYLLRRAVAWGNMSLAELMGEIVQEEGDLSRYLALLQRRY
jgi:type VI secretion system protein ImpA